MMNLKRKFYSFIATAAFIAAGLTFTPSSSFAQCEVLGTNGLIGHWKLDETTATTTVTDATGNHDGTMSGAAWNASTVTLDGVIDTAFDFPTGNYFIDFPATADHKPNNFTISLWYKPAGGISDDTLVYLGPDPYDAAIGYHIESEGTGNKIRFLAGDGTSGYGIVTSDNTISTTEWTHIVATSAEGERNRVYVNGVLDIEAASVRSAMDYTGTSELHIGKADLSSGADPMEDGQLDDIRLYNRALTADEVNAIYLQRSNATPAEGQLTYNTTNSLMQYCDGTDWRMAGVGSYNPNAVYFDGSSDQLDETSMSAAASTNTDKYSASFWYYPDPNMTEDSDVIWDGSAGDGGDIQIMITDDGNASNDQITFFTHGRNADDEDLLSMGSNAVPVGAWYHVLISVDLANSRSDMYINDVQNTGWNDLFVETPLEFNLDTHQAITTSFNRMHGSIADLWIDVGTYIDFSIEANRRKFISENGMPMYLGANGSIPLGVAPDIFLSGDTENWHTNKGTGGGFTENGALTTANTLPADNLTVTGNIASGLVGYWKLDEASGTLADSSASGNDGTAVGSVVYAQTGKVNNAMEFGASNAYVGLGSPPELYLTDDITVSVWGYRHTDDSADMIFVCDNTPRTDDSDNKVFLFRLSSSDRLYAEWMYAGSTNLSLYSDATVPTPSGAWHHYAVTKNKASQEVKFYLNGTQLGSTETYTDDQVGGENFSCFIGIDEDLSSEFDGLLDEVRVYNRTLSDDDITNLYSNGIPGKLQYNNNFNVMEYYNGVEWVAMGPLGGTPPTNGLVAHWKLDESSGTTVTDSSGNGHTGTEGSGLDIDTASATGKIDGAITFDGGGENIDIPDDAEWTLSNGKQMTIAGWFNFSTLPASNINDWDSIISGASDAYGFQFNGVNASTAIKINWYDGSNDYLSPDINIGTGEWHHVAITVDLGGAANSSQWWFDGQSVGTFTAPSVSVNPSGISIGGAGGSTSFTGSLDDVRIYNRMLTETEISQLYHYGASGGLGDVSGNCSNPTHPEGAMIYSTDENLLQYCNGEEWIGVGK